MQWICAIQWLGYLQLDSYRYEYKNKCTNKIPLVSKYFWRNILLTNSFTHGRPFYFKAISFIIFSSNHWCGNEFNLSSGTLHDIKHDYLYDHFSPSCQHTKTKHCIMSECGAWVYFNMCKTKIKLTLKRHLLWVFNFEIHTLRYHFITVSWDQSHRLVTTLQNPCYLYTIHH